MWDAVCVETRQIFFAAEFWKRAKKDKRLVKIGLLLLMIHFHASTFKNHKYVSAETCGNVLLLVLPFCQYHVGVGASLTNEYKKKKKINLPKDM